MLGHHSDITGYEPCVLCNCERFLPDNLILYNNYSRYFLCVIIRALQYIDISSYRGITMATILYLGPTNRNRDTKISIIPNI